MKSPYGDEVFKVNTHAGYTGSTINERVFPMSLRRMYRKRERKMPLCGPVFAQFSAER